MLTAAFLRPVCSILCSRVPVAQTLRSFTMASTTASAEVKSDPLVMYIFVRTDLDWPQGAVAAQACHGEAGREMLLFTWNH